MMETLESRCMLTASGPSFSIDEFNDGDLDIVSTPETFTGIGDEDLVAAIGGERDTTLVQPSDAPGDTHLRYEDGLLKITNDDQGVWQTHITYDGLDDDHLAFDNVGLGGIDVTNNGELGAFNVRLSATKDFWLELFAISSNGTGVGSAFVEVDVNAAGSGVMQDYYINFEDFDDDPNIAPLDFSDLGALVMNVWNDSPNDVSVDYIRTVPELPPQFTIDEFNDGDLVVVSTPQTFIGVGDEEFVSVIGGERDTTLEQPSDEPGDTNLRYEDGLLKITNDDQGVWQTHITYDGIDEDHLAFDNVGLGGIDVTNNGELGAFNIRLSATEDFWVELFAISSNGTGVGSAFIEVDVNAAGSGVMQDYYINFEDFDDDPIIAPLDFSDLGALVLNLWNDSPNDVSVDYIRAVPELPPQFSIDEFNDGDLVVVSTPQTFVGVGDEEEASVLGGERDSTLEQPSDTPGDTTLRYEDGLLKITNDDQGVATAHITYDGIDLDHLTLGSLGGVDVTDDGELGAFNIRFSATEEFWLELFAISSNGTGVGSAIIAVDVSQAGVGVMQDYYINFEDFDDDPIIAPLDFSDLDSLVMTAWNAEPNDLAFDYIRTVPEVAPLYLEATADPQQVGVSLDGPELQSVVTAAINQWGQAGIGEQAIAALRDVDVRVQNLSHGLLGLATSDSIIIDVNASGRGWYVDAAAGAGHTPRGTVDLLTTVTHEFGHVLGYGHVASNQHVMSATLTTGMRREITNTDGLVPLTSETSQLNYANALSTDLATARGRSMYFDQLPSVATSRPVTSQLGVLLAQSSSSFHQPIVDRLFAESSRQADVLHVSNRYVDNVWREVRVDSGDSHAFRIDDYESNWLADIVDDEDLDLLALNEAILLLDRGDETPDGDESSAAQPLSSSAEEVGLDSEEGSVNTGDGRQGDDEEVLAEADSEPTTTA